MKVETEETAVILNQLRLLSMDRREREAMTVELLPLVDKIIEEESQNLFNPQEFWEDFKEVLFELQLATRKTDTADKIECCIASIDDILISIEEQE